MPLIVKLRRVFGFLCTYTSNKIIFLKKLLFMKITEIDTYVLDLQMNVSTVMEYINQVA